MAIHLRRREFIFTLGGAAAAAPLAARAQQPTMPVIGFLGAGSPDTMAGRLRAFRQGLKDSGYVEGENVAIEYRWAGNQIDQLPGLAAELVRQRVAVIRASGRQPGVGSQGGDHDIPIVFFAPEDPVKLGLVTSLARPEGNVTGVNFFFAEVAPKRWNSCVSWCPQRLCGRVRQSCQPSNMQTTLREVRWLRAPWDCKSRSTTPAPSAR